MSVIYVLAPPPPRCLVGLRRRGHGRPAWGAGCPAAANRRPVRPGPSVIKTSIPRHSAVAMNSVLPSCPPSMQAKHARPASTVSSTPPPSPTRTHCRPGTLANQIAPSASAQMPSSACATSAQTRRWPSVPSAATSKPTSCSACESATTSVRPRSTSDIPFGHRSPSATCRTLPSGRTSTKCARTSVDVGVARGVHHDLIEWRRAELGEAGEDIDGPSRLDQEPASGSIDNQQASVGKPIDAERQRLRRKLRDDLPTTVLTDRQDLAGAPIAQPHPTIPPPGRLGKAELLDHHIQRHRSHPS